MERGPSRDYSKGVWRALLGPEPDGGEALVAWRLERNRLTQARRRAGLLLTSAEEAVEEVASLVAVEEAVEEAASTATRPSVPAAGVAPGVMQLLAVATGFGHKSFFFTGSQSDQPYCSFFSF
jgi:hypothetical protein